MKAAWVFARRQHLAAGRSRASLLLHLLNVLFTAACYAFLARLVPGDALARWTPGDHGYFVFVITGVAVSGAMLSGMRLVSEAFELSRAVGALRTVFFGRLPVATVLMLSSPYPLARAGVDFLVWLGLGWLIGAFSVASPNWLALAILSVLSLASFTALALLVAGGGLLLGHSGPLLWLVPSISWLVGGVLYPAALLPAPLAWMAELVPLTHALDGVRGALVTGASLTDLWRPAVCLAISTVTTFVLAVLAFRGGLARARAHGDLVAA